MTSGANLVGRHAVHASAQTHEWETPAALFAAYHAEFGFTVDVAASHANAKCARYYTAAEDGLVQPWAGEVCWMNPPYGTQIAQWMRKAWEESQRGATVVCLIPARTDTGWWHDYAMRGEIRFLRGRVRFERGGVPHGDRRVGGWTAPFPSAVVVFRPEPPR